MSTLKLLFDRTKKRGRQCIYASTAPLSLKTVRGRSLTRLRRVLFGSTRAVHSGERPWSKLCAACRSDHTRPMSYGAQPSRNRRKGQEDFQSLALGGISG